MDPKNNPFTPGAGFRPPELAGRDSAVADAEVAMAQVKAGRPTQGTIVYGLRGVGKTVLLNIIEERARAEGFEVIAFEATDKVGLGEALVPELQAVLSRLSKVEKARSIAVAALNTLRDVAAAMELEYQGAKLGVKKREEVPAAGSIEMQLRAVMEEAGEAAQAAERPIALLVDELQYLQLRDEGREFGALIAALHRVGQRGLPMVLFGAGLPQVMGIASRQRSYAERIFRFTKVGPLAGGDAQWAIRGPVEAQGARITDEGLARIVELTQGYPYFLQEYGRHAWLAASESPITLEDVERAHVTATAALDDSFFESRMQRVTERERDYMLAMTGLGEGPYRTSAIAAALGGETSQFTPYRDGLIKKGMVWATKRGEVDFTVPMFDRYLRRHAGGGDYQPSPLSAPSGLARELLEEDRGE